jgi:HAE1 family hydrophobic/amphiphilic exporter-1
LEVAQSLSRSNITYPAGQVKDNTFEYVVRVLGAFNKVSDFNRVAVAVDRSRLSSTLTPSEVREKKRRGPTIRQAGQPILLGDVARVKDALPSEQSYSRYDGRATVTLAVLKQAEANVVRVADDVKLRLDNIRSKLPARERGWMWSMTNPLCQRRVAGDVERLRAGRCFGVLDAHGLFGYPKRRQHRERCHSDFAFGHGDPLWTGKGLSLNTITLAGLAIGVGSLVDGAIVVQENISRHRAMGKSAPEAAIVGAQEVFGAVTSSNLTSIAVFFPLIFVTGLVGQIFGGLSWSVIFSLLSSQVVAFTVIPMLAATAGPEGKPLAFVQRLSARVAPWHDRYFHTLEYAFKHPGRVVGWTAAALLVSLAFLSIMPRSLFPKTEGKEILIRLDLPAGSPLSRTNDVALSVEKSLKDIPGIAHCAAIVGSIAQEGLQPLGPNQAQLVLSLTEGRRPKTSEMVRLIQNKFQYMKAAHLYVFQQGGTFAFLGARGAPVSVEVKGADLAQVEQVSRDVMEKMKTVPGLSNLRTSISERAPELQLNVKREALADVSLSVSDVAETALTALKGKVVSKFREAGREIDIRLRLRKEDRDSPLAVQDLFVQSPLEVTVPLGSVAEVIKGHGPSEIVRYDQERTILVSADLAGRSLTKVTRDVERILAPYKDQKGVTLTPAGEAARMAESFRNLKLVLALSILFVFMIMASQFESLWEPFLILVSIPFALIGMAPALFLFRHDVSAMAGMGVVLLAGIVVNNGIILIDFVNQSRTHGVGLIEGLRQACTTRLRPILMTALTTILGMTPLALGLGEGADLQAPLAVVVVSGLLVSTGLTLIVLPAVFLLVERNLLDPNGRKTLLNGIAHYFRRVRDNNPA